MKKEIKKHEKDYIHISKKQIGLFFLSILGIGLSYLNMLVIISTGKLLSVWELLGFNAQKTEYISTNQLLICYPIIGEYILIVLTIICITAMFKGGFDKLKSYDEEGLIGGLIGGLIFGLIGGLIGGLIFGLPEECDKK